MHEKTGSWNQQWGTQLGERCEAGQAGSCCLECGRGGGSDVVVGGEVRTKEIDCHHGHL